MLTNLFNNLKFALDYIFDWFNLTVNFEINTICVIFFILNLFVIFVFPYFFKISFLFKIKICIKKLICISWFFIKFNCVFLVKQIVSLYCLCTKKIKTYLVILIVNSLFYDFLNCIITLILKAKFRCSAKKPKYFDCAPIDLIDEYGDITDKCRRGGNDYSDKSNPYTEQFEELKSFLENRNVKNLAVFGSYGAGKSSFLKTFFTHYTVNGRRDEDNVIYISLPDFKYTKNDKIINQTHTKHNIVKDNKRAINAKNHFESSEKDSHNLNLETVETEIIRQLVHGKISKKIPVSLFSNFKTDTVEIITISLFILSFIAFFIICKNHNIGIKEFFNIDNYLLLRLLLLLLFFGSIFKYFSKRFRFSNVSFFNVGVSAKDKSEKSIFDSYLDEITYLFEESNCRYVVFEDLDRTDNYEVLTHLRNLNFILNNDYRCIDNLTGKQRKIVFIYVIRRDIFNTAQETVKFFDASIHVQNVITSANSREFFIKYRNDLCKRFKNDNLKKQFLSKENLTDEFLSNIAFFMTDLRLVKMIFNDYLNILGSLDTVFSTLEISSIKLFARRAFSYAVFRSVYPIEFEELLKDEGFIFNYLNRKLSYYKKLDEPEYNLNLNTVEEEKESTLLEKQSQSGNFGKTQLTEYLSIRPLLKLLIDEKSECLAEDYRLYSALFPKDKFKNKPNDVKFLSGILNSSNEYSPHLEISKYIAEVILQYFPNTVFDCNSIFNYQFFYSILTRIVLTNNNTYNKMLEKYTSLAVNKLAKAQYYYDKRNKIYSKREPIEISDFFVGVCDFISPSSPNYNDLSSEKMRLWLIMISNQFASLYYAPKGGDSILGKIKSAKFFAYILNYCSDLFKKDDDSDKFKNYNLIHIKEWISKELSRSSGLQEFLANNSIFVTNELFSSLASLNVQFSVIQSNLSVKDRSNSYFLMYLINRYKLDKDHNVSFFFEENHINFSIISKYLIELFKNISINNSDIKFYNQQTESNIYRLPSTSVFLTILLNVTDESILDFNEAFFRYLVVTEHYENLLNAISFPFLNTQRPYLNDNEDIIFFVILMMCLSYIKNGSQKSEDKFDLRLTKFNTYFKLNHENYSEHSLFNNVLFCFLDAESQKINELEPVLKKTIAYNYMDPHVDLTKDNIFCKWMNIYPAFNFNNGLNLYKAFAKAFSVLLDYSCLEPQKHAIDASITNIIYIRNILDRRLTDDYPRVYPDMSSINEYKLCWDSLSQFFYKYYKEIFASDKDKQYNLSSDFDKSPYNFDETKNCISSLKMKE